MKVGDYVRTKYDGILKIRNIKEEKFYNEYYSMGKVTSYQETDTFVYYRDDDMRISVKDVIKSSPNIIDLIEVGDYVNGQLVKHIAYFEGVEEPIKKLIFADEYHLIPTEVCEQNEIKSIVTKEQFESMEYEVT